MGAAMNDILVSIDSHALDESIPIPYVGVRGPLTDILMPEWQVRNILELKTFSVRFAPSAIPAGKPDLPAPAPASAPEPEAQPEAQPEPEAEDMTPDEVVALRDRILALTTVKAARTLAAEFGLELPPAATKLEDLRAALLAPVEAALAAE